MSKLTNLTALNIASAVLVLKQKNQLENKGIIFLRNNRILKPIVEEYEEIKKALQDKWGSESKLDLKKYDSDEKYRVLCDSAFQTYLNESEDLKDFLLKEIELDLVTFPESNIEKETFDWQAVEVLIGNIITI